MRPAASAPGAHAPAPTGGLGRLARRGLRLGGWRAEALAFGLAFVAYQAARALGRGSLEDALARARRPGAGRRPGARHRRRGLGPGGAAGHALARCPRLGLPGGAVTLALAAGIVLVHRAAPRSTARCAPRCWPPGCWPCRSTRSLRPRRRAWPGLGIADTVSANTPIVLSSGSTTALSNPYAAVPSLHAGFALALGVAVFLSARPPCGSPGPCGGRW